MGVVEYFSPLGTQNLSKARVHHYGWNVLDITCLLIIEEQHKRLHFRSAVCTLLYLANNTRADILFAVCKLAKACISPGKANFHALIWLISYLQQRPYYAIKFCPDTTSNPVYNICHTAYHTPT